MKVFFCTSVLLGVILLISCNNAAESNTEAARDSIDVIAPDSSASMPSAANGQSQNNSLTQHAGSDSASVFRSGDEDDPGENIPSVLGLGQLESFCRSRIDQQGNPIFDLDSNIFSGNQRINLKMMFKCEGKQFLIPGTYVVPKSKKKKYLKNYVENIEVRFPDSTIIVKTIRKDSFKNILKPEILQYGTICNQPVIAAYDEDNKKFRFVFALAIPTSEKEHTQVAELTLDKNGKIEVTDNANRAMKK